MKISNHGVAFIKTFEALRLDAYLDGGGVLTIGYGHTGPEVKKGDHISLAQSETLLRADLQWAEKAVNDAVKVAVTQDVYDSLCSFVFNTGRKAFEDSTLLKLLNASDYIGACAELAKWHKDNDKNVKGLLRRRVREMMVWLEN